MTVLFFLSHFGRIAIAAVFTAVLEVKSGTPRAVNMKNEINLIKQIIDLSLLMI